MKLIGLRIEPLRIPFRTSFTHSNAVRSMTQSVLVRVETDAGHRGLGEGCPREYVTGESIASTLAFCAQWRGELIAEISTLTDLRHWMSHHEDEINADPAAWCAIELALLDVLAQSVDQTVESLLGLAALEEPFRYTAILDDGSPEQFANHLETYAQQGFTDFKLKVSGNASVDRDRLQRIVQRTPHARLRVDANNLWSTAEEATEYLDSLGAVLFGIEEPLRAKDFTGMRTLSDIAPVILDESLLRTRDLAHVDATPNRFIANLRVSKLGGLLRSLDVAEAAKQAGVPIIVGAQVGETSILTRAAWTLAHACREQLVAQEGAFGTLLLKRDVTDPSLQFGPEGLVDPRKCLDQSRRGWQLGESSA